MFCSNCGKQTDGVYCKYCGTRLTGVEDAFPHVDFVPEAPGFVPEKEIFGREEALGETVVLEPLDAYAPEEGPRRELGEENPSFQFRPGLGRDPYDVPEPPWPEAEFETEGRRKVSKKGKRKKSGKKKAVKAVKFAGRSAGKTVGAVGRAAGGAAGRVIPTILRLFSVLLMAVILVRLGREFWIERAVLGPVLQVVSDKNYGEALYLVLSGLTLVYGLCSMLWMASRRQMVYEGKLKKFDTGRGFTAFLVFALLAFLASGTALLIPYRPGLLSGLSQYLLVAASVQYVIYGCSALGIVCCIIRKKIKG